MIQDKSLPAMTEFANSAKLSAQTFFLFVFLLLSNFCLFFVPRHGGYV